MRPLVWFRRYSGLARTIEQPLVSPVLIDKFNRQHTYLRISLTERCNLRCTYCMPEQGVKLSPESNLMTTAEIIRLARLFVSQGVTKIRLTGGEPTVRPDIIELIAQLGQLKNQGLQSLGMTTNGIILRRLLPRLHAAGLDKLNISLDTLDSNKFTLITRRKGWENVMASIDEAVNMGFCGVKVNVVVMRRINDDEVGAFAEMTLTKNVDVRFIEYMPFDDNRWTESKLVPYQELISVIKSRFPSLERLQDHPNDTSKAYKIPGAVGQIGFVTSMTDHFCNSCNRIRLTADGNFKVCLFGPNEVSLRDLLRKGLTDEELLPVISTAVGNKKAKHAGISQKPTNTARWLKQSLLLGPAIANIQFVRLFSSCTFIQSQRSRDTTVSHDDLPSLSHVDLNHKAQMVDVSSKKITKRTAIAEAFVSLPPHVFERVQTNTIHKGDVLTVAQLAGVMAAKQTSNLIPLCHPLALSHIDVKLQLHRQALPLDPLDWAHIHIVGTVSNNGVTGVEMEALMCVSVAALTVYDMVKAVSHQVCITNIRLLEKTGGKKDFHHEPSV